MEFTEFKNRLNEFLLNPQITQTSLSIMANVPQSQICGWVNGKGKLYTKNAKKVMDAIEDYQKKNTIYFSMPNDLHSTISNVLAGKPERKQVLIDIIQSLKPILK